ncbi:helix-turn-helix domain-containing protein [Streptomyces sp. NPDC059629]|uniref:helix-turn-helix domain-containing protein n=1 Tax=Streptomyces sp. NPDC059629 TaxID=3346889 RepID=UPI00369393A0
MPRRAIPLNPDDGPQARFALALRRLRDEAGFDAKTIDVIAAENHMPRSTLYAALRGTRIPTVPVLAALVRAWGGDQTEWLIRRTETEAEIEELRLREPNPSGPEETRSAIRRGRAAVLEVLRNHGDKPIAELQEASPEHLMIKPWSNESVLKYLRDNWRDDMPDLWETLRRIAGAPTIRTIANGTQVSQAQVSSILKGQGRHPNQVQVVRDYLDTQADLRIR